jgi:hypothetical protein
MFGKASLSEAACFKSCLDKYCIVDAEDSLLMTCLCLGKLL